MKFDYIDFVLSNP